MLLTAAIISAAPHGGQAAPPELEVKTLMKNHVQGMAVDTAASCYYLSFTTSLLKVDYEGNVLASVDSINGHLGAMTFDPAERILYASLECKDDEIGRGVAKSLQAEAVAKGESRFYIAAVKVDALDRMGVPMSEAIDLHEIREAVADYGKRYGAAGIDGVTIAPRIGRKNGPARLYVAYGVYGDTTRTDNDHQILLEFKPGKFSRHEAKYFIYTGNTTYGVQNLAYDPATRNIFMAVYRGKKSKFPNFSLFAVPVDQKPVKGVLKGLESDGKHKELKLWQEAGIVSEVPGIRGWYFSGATTGFCTVGNGVWYNSTPLRKGPGAQTAIVRRLHWAGGTGDNPFVVENSRPGR